MAMSSALIVHEKYPSIYSVFSYNMWESVHVLHVKLHVLTLLLHKEQIFTVVGVDNRGCLAIKHMYIHVYPYPNIYSTDRYPSKRRQ